MRRIASIASLLALAALALLGGCGEPRFSDAEKKIIASLALNTLPSLKPDTTNQYGDVPAAAALGSTLFFDAGMSRDGTVSCST
ncbi:methylamine utilization protein, partial [Mesorhizobium sp. M2C.T.Ca.TU.002.02.1.1]